ncbi:DUF441 domain-containing protein [Hazenella sp. IB182357]|uniref:UPF0756 membrane protein IC620_12810 n=1 Tax=Polycladospora coralii TaxID=2771432 RepID=A0A926RV64_9BACL|nr:DUF441 domain-containing protein [Polycladospora coralii]MBD1373229.1 DUF441 domain-containing protein [Polycladospora coralii]MBS7530887.1 DUF441 domain-containing protein [Polycladospora coralii]
MKPEFILVCMIGIGIVGRSHLIATAASFLLILRLIDLERIYPLIERRGLEFGLLFLTIAILVPFASGQITSKEIFDVLSSPIGLIALVGGILATYTNGSGLDLIKLEPQIIIGIVFGSMIGILFFRGIPVGPLMAAGITALLYKLFHFITQ